MSLGWLSPLWSESTTLEAPAPPDECARRLQVLAGKPSWFFGAPTSGRVNPDGFELAQRRSDTFGMWWAAATCYGTFERIGNHTRVNLELRHSPGAMVGFGATFVSYYFVAIVAGAAPMWRWAIPLIAVAGWAGAAWVGHRLGVSLRQTITGILQMEDPDGAAQADRRRLKSARRRGSLGAREDA